MYNKLFTKILDSSIWMEPTHTRLVWITFIAAMDETGFVPFASVHNVAHRAVVSVEEATKAVECLEKPDPNSSDPENEGRRIERVSGGWMVLNSEKYRAIATREHQKELNRERVKKYRHKAKGNAPVMLSNETVTPSEAYTEAEALNTKTPQVEGVVYRNVPKCPSGVQSMSTHNPHIAEAHPLTKKTPNSSELLDDEIPFGSDDSHPTEEEFDAFLEDEGLIHVQAKGNQWDQLQARGWRDSKLKPIRDWKEYVRRLEPKMEADHPANN